MCIRDRLIIVSVLSGIVSVVFSSIAFMVQYILGGTISIPVGTVLIAMISVHFLIGFGEGVITALIVGLLIRDQILYTLTIEKIKTQQLFLFMDCSLC